MLFFVEALPLNVDGPKLLEPLCQFYAVHFNQVEIGLCTNVMS